MVLIDLCFAIRWEAISTSISNFLLFKFFIIKLDLKNDLVLHYNNWKEKFQFDNEISQDVKDNAIKILDSITNFANSEDYSDNYLQEFINWTTYLDKTRKQSILDVVPQYDKLFV